jgi:hypothetical protein
MRAMKLSRLAAGTSVAIVILTAWLGACTTTGTEPCGPESNKNGTCEEGTTCPSGTYPLNVTDPVDECPGSNGANGENYICCAPTSGSDAGTASSPSGTTDASANPG